MNEAYDLLWKQILNNLRKTVSKDFFNYFNNTSLVELNENKAVITTNTIINSYMLNSEKDAISAAFEELFNSKFDIDIEYVENYKRNIFTETIFEEFNDNLSDEFTFDNFIEGPSNLEAKTAALACATAPGNRYYNPLIIYGNSGLGKTHLLNAIGNFIKKNDNENRILYISSRDFVNEVVKALKDNTIDDYKNKLNTLDVLLVDDIQFLSGKEKSNEIFFDIYNELFNNRKQVVLTSDRLPSEIKDIHDRLKTRFSQGLAVTITSLEYETAYKILESKMIQHNIDNIDSDVIGFLATNFRSDVRQLEGSLNRIIFYATNFSKNPDKNIDLELCTEAFKGQQAIIIDSQRPLEIGSIIKAVCDYYGLTKQQIISKSRTKNIATARHIAMFLCRKHLDESFDKIGDAFGGKDHTTVMSACEKIEKLVKDDEVYKKIISDIENVFIKK